MPKRKHIVSLSMRLRRYHRAWSVFRCNAMNRLHRKELEPLVASAVKSVKPRRVTKGPYCGKKSAGVRRDMKRSAI